MLAAGYLRPERHAAAEYQQLEERIRELHPYEVPEVIAVPIESGQREYLTWISDSVGRPRPQHAE